MALECSGDWSAIKPLIAALHDANPHRRHAAARSLGWIPKPGHTAAEALSRALDDSTQPQPVREEAAESLAYLYSNRAIPTLIAALTEPDVRIRFWAVFGLGSIQNRRTGLQRDPRVVPALESVLSDDEVPPGNWWAVKREALAMLGNMNPQAADYRVKLADEIRRVQADPHASMEDCEWAKGYEDFGSD